MVVRTPAGGYAVALTRAAHGEADAGNRGINGRLGRVDDKPEADRHRQRDAVNRKGPGIRGICLLEGDTAVCIEITGSSRRATLGQIVRTRADDAADQADSPGQQAAIGQSADAHGEIDVVLEQIDDADRPASAVR